MMTTPRQLPHRTHRRHLRLACIALISALLGLHLPYPNDAFVSAGIAPASAKKGSDKIEDDVDEKVNDKVEEEVAEAMEDYLEEIAKAEEKLEKALLEQIEKGAEATDKVDKAVEELLETQVEAQEELDEELQEIAEDAAEDAQDALEDRLKDQQDDNRGRNRNRNSDSRSSERFEEIVNRRGERVIGDELMMLISPDELTDVQNSGINILSQQTLDGMDLILLKVAASDIAMEDTIESIAERDLESASVDYNHLYTPDTDTIEANLTSPPSQPVTAFKALLQFNTDRTLNGELGMIDSAIDQQHSCLADSTIIQQIFLPESHHPAYDHGTAVASILAGNNRCASPGLTTGLTLKNAAVFFQRAEGSVGATAEHIILGLNWLIQQKVPVINMALSGPPNKLMERIIDNASHRGTVIVAAVGNTGPRSEPQYPAAYPQVIGVSAIDRDMAIYHRAHQGKSVGLTAPGVQLKVAAPDNRYTVQSGTSMATPFVSAILMAHITEHPQTSPHALASWLSASAKDLGTPGIDTVFGHGLVQYRPYITH